MDTFFQRGDRVKARNPRHKFSGIIVAAYHSLDNVHTGYVIETDKKKFRAFRTKSLQLVLNK